MVIIVVFVAVVLRHTLQVSLAVKIYAVVVCVVVVLF